MGISDKITSIENHLIADYEGLENIGADLTNINKNIENIRPVLDTIYSNLPKVSNEGTEVTLTPTLKGKLGIVEKGNSTQEVSDNCLNLQSVLPTTANSYNEKNPTLTNGVINVKGTNNTSYSSKGAYQNGFVQIGTTKEWVASTTYYISMKIEVVSNQKGLSTSSFNACLYGSKTGALTYNSTSGRYEGSINSGSSLPSSTPNFLELRIDGCELNISEISLKTTNSYTFEGYGIKPTPDLESPIKSVTGNNNVVVFNGSLTEQGGINDTTGAENSATTRIKTDYVEIPDYTSMQITSNNTNLVFRAIHFYNSSKTWVSSSGYVGSALPYTVSSIPSNAKYFKVVFQGQNASIDLSPTGNYLIIGTPQTLPLNLGTIELNKIGTYQDLIFKNVPSSAYYNNTLTEGSWYIKNNIKKMLANELANNFTLHEIRTNTVLIKYYIGDSFDNQNPVIPLLCNNFTWGVVYSNDIEGFQEARKQIYFSINKTRLATADLSGAKTWLSSSNTIVNYILETPTYTEITQTELINQLNAIDGMLGYDGTTVITSTYNESNAQMFLEVSALKGV